MARPILVIDQGTNSTRSIVPDGSIVVAGAAELSLRVYLVPAFAGLTDGLYPDPAMFATGRAAGPRSAPALPAIAWASKYAGRRDAMARSRPAP